MKDDSASRRRKAAERSPSVVPDPISPPVRILLADDHHVVRQGLAAIISTEPDLVIVGEACDGETACQLFLRLQPDVLILDLRMPVLDGFGVVKRVIASSPQARILIMTTYDADEDVWRSLRAGARGYVLKDASQPEIIAAIRAVAAGESFTTPRLAMKLARRASAPELTDREQEVLRHLATGGTNKDIAAAIGLGEGTVKTHVRNVLQKLGARTRTEAVRIAKERGLLHLFE